MSRNEILTIANFNSQYIIKVYNLQLNSTLNEKISLNRGDRHSEFISSIYTWCIIAFPINESLGEENIYNHEHNNNNNIVNNTHVTEWNENDKTIYKLKSSIMLILQLPNYILNDMKTISMLWNPSKSTLSVSQRSRLPLFAQKRTSGGNEKTSGNGNGYESKTNFNNIYYNNNDMPPPHIILQVLD
jgi:hypothetical protein